MSEKNKKVTTIGFIAKKSTTKKETNQNNEKDNKTVDNK